MDARTLGANIQKYRRCHHITQEKAAESCGLSVGYFRQIEQGHKIPKLETFLKIAEVLGTPTDKLLSGNLSWTDQVETYGILEKLEKLPEQERSEALQLLDCHIEILKNRSGRKAQRGA